MKQLVRTLQNAVTLEDIKYGMKQLVKTLQNAFISVRGN
jgi:hypothetical protein